MSISPQAELQAAREHAARVGLGTRVVLLIVKILAALATGSIGIFADAVHGVVDVTGATVGFIGVRVAGKPPDEEHRFGHGRAEDIAAASIATLIFLAAGIVAYEAIDRLGDGATLERLGAGIAATAFVVVLKLVLSRYLLRAASRLDSVAIDAMSKDFGVDALSSGAVLVGLILVRATGQVLLDPIVAIIVVVIIVRAAYSTMRDAITNLMDTRLPAAEEQAIRHAIETRPDINNYHALRTRKAGRQRYVQFHIVVPRDKTVEEGHRIAEETEDDIRALFPQAAVTIHVEPCTPDCAECPAQCDDRDSNL